jgi:Uma2 family endonuclease
MSLPAQRLRPTYAEYLEVAAQSDFLVEFFDGELWLMSGGTPEHALLIANTTIALGLALRGSTCRIYSEALRVYMPVTNDAAYPDLKVICGPVEHDPVDTDAAINPSLVVEVLSSSTESFDRGEKFVRYRSLPSLQAYLMVDQHTARLELFERQDDGSWRYTAAEAGERLALRALGIVLAVDEVYQGVELKPRLKLPR